ncbi:MAG: hypothetical protein IKY83_01345 [Proteobacteria bacterium]|nr:hypothetical protein [Pseudomonadota bacterium]
MTKKYLNIISILAISFCFSACDDPEDPSTQDPIVDPGPEVPEDCATLGCGAGRYCHEHECVDPVASGKPCLEDVPCAKDLVCTDGICTQAPEDTSCVTKGCPFGEFCDGEKCVNAIPTGKPCVESVPCEEGAYCANDVCTPHLTEGSACTKSDVCASDLSCIVGTCRKPLTKGDSCAGDLELSCPIPLICGPAQKCADYVSIGDTCGDTEICETGNCIDGTCKPPAKLGEACDEINACDKALACQDGVCLQTYGTCKYNSDCAADSYCCTLPACDTPEVCFAYGEGPGGEYNNQCRFNLKPGIFEASVQCEWNGSGADLPDANQIMSTIMAADLPFDSGTAVELVAISFSTVKNKVTTALRIFNGETCELLQTIENPDIFNSANPALADIDNDGLIEIVAPLNNKGAVAYHWDEQNKRYDPKPFWNTSGCDVDAMWGGPSIHDINNDGVPEVIVDWAVYDGKTGKCINTASTQASAATDPNSLGRFPVLADIDLDPDGKIELVSTQLWHWNSEDNTWELIPDSYKFGYSFGYADFGTPKNDGSFDFTKLDGKAEIVATGKDYLRVYAFPGTMILESKLTVTLGTPNIGDFDGDGLPEIGVAGKDSYYVVDPGCGAQKAKCENDESHVLWSSKSQDNSSGYTGSSIFDFDSDGKTEVIYGDECFTRIYDGLTGEVVFSSARTSNTAFENPVILDPDQDMSAEIIIGSDSVANSLPCPEVDNMHHGVKCIDDEDCYSNKCVEGYCRCNADSECNWQRDAQGQVMNEYKCTDPLAPQKAEDGKVCRAKHTPNVKHPGFRILRDRLDRWASARTLWTQHAYAVTHINDDGSIPKTSAWKQNFTDPKMNNFRQNSNGNLEAGFAPDITGRFIKDNVCGKDSQGKYIIQGYLCNRGRKDVGSKLPATFYKGDPAEGNIICTSYTDSNVPAGSDGCRYVKCEMEDLVTGRLTMVVNDDGKGGRTTVECDTNNNTDTIDITECTLVN